MLLLAKRFNVFTDFSKLFAVVTNGFIKLHGSYKQIFLKRLSHQIFKPFLSSTILNQYFLYGR
jgi:hypothetical protein